MVDAKPVIWSPLADDDLGQILNYLDKHWGTNVSVSFLDAIDKCLAIIQTSPDAFPVFNTDKSIRRCVVTKHNSLFFKEYNTYIAILRLYDTRQNPEKLKFE
jgi:plasmid stabilization system protein ParE